MLLEELVAGDGGITSVTYLLVKQADKRRQLTWRFLAVSPEGEADDRPDSYQSSTENWFHLQDSTRLLHVIPVGCLA